jgi:hypothetical protein
MDTSFFGVPSRTSNDVQISPLTSSLSTPLFTYPNQLTYVVDPLMISRINIWVNDHLLTMVNSSDFRVSSRIRIGTQLLAGGGVLDRLPPYAHYESKTFIYAGGSIDGSTSPLTPVWADMLTHLVLGKSANSTYIDLFSNMNAAKLLCEPY